VLIDWFTVVAQIVNFLVLIALLKRFLFGRIVQAIDEREKGIATRLAEAEEKNTSAAREMEKCRALAAEHQQKCEAILDQAKRDAEEERKDLVAKARESVRGLEQKWRTDLALEKRVFLDDLRKRAAAGVLTVARRALADLASRDVEQAVVETFIERLRTLDAGALRALTGELTVLSSKTPSPEQQNAIRKVLEDRLGTVNIQFIRDDSMPWGIELRGNGRRIGWNPDTYLDSLEESIRGALETEREEHQYAA
jgi:F-type H+-transporting ATPase subunit b